MDITISEIRWEYGGLTKTMIILDELEIQEWKIKIDKTTHFEMGCLIRFSPPGAYPFF